MNSYLFLPGLAILASVFYIFEISFKSFSKISLAGFFDDYERLKQIKFDFVKNYQTFSNSLTALSILLQLTFFISLFLALNSLVPSQWLRIGLLLPLFLFFFNVMLYSISYFNREYFLKKLIFLYLVPWLFFYPANIFFSFFLGKRSEEREIEQDDPSEKELEVFFEEGTKEGVLEKEDKEMLESVIEFGDTLVKEIMTPRVDMIYVNIESNLNDLIKIINEKKKSRYPVIKDRIDNIEGIVLSKDVFSYLNKKKDFNIKRIIRTAFFIPESMRIIELLNEMQKSKQKFAMVVDEFGGISGVVTMEDIIEEIVGEIKDEFDDDIEQIIKEKDHFIVKGDTDISELCQTLNIELPDEDDFQTVAGFISYKSGRIPKITEKVKHGNYLFEVLEIEKNRITKVKIHQEM